MKRHLIYHTPVELNQTGIGNDRVSIGTNTHASLNTSIQTISKDGMTITCDQHDLQLLLPNRVCISPKQPVQLPISFTLTKKIQASCNIVCVRRLSKNIFQLELRFNHMKEKDEELLDYHIEKLLKLKYNEENITKVA